MFRRFFSLTVGLLLFTGMFFSSAWGQERWVSSPSLGPGGLVIGGPKGEAELSFPIPPGPSVVPSRLELSVRCPEGSLSGTLSVFWGNVMVGSYNLAPGDNRIVFPLSGLTSPGTKVSVRVLVSLSKGNWDDPSQDVGVQITSGRLVLAGAFSMPKSVSQWLASLNDGVAVVVPNEARDEELSAGFALVGTLSRLLPGGRVVLLKASEEVSEPFLPKVRVQLDDQQAEGVTLDSGGANLLVNGVSRQSLRDLCAKIFDPTLMGIMQGATVTGLSEASDGAHGACWSYRRLSRSWAPGWSYELGDLFLWGGVVEGLSLTVKGVVPLAVKGEGSVDLYVNGQLACSERLEDRNVDVILDVPDWVNLKVKNRLKLVVRGAAGPSSLQVAYAKVSYGKAYGMLGDLGALMKDNVPVLIERNLKWTGVLGALSAFRWLCSLLPPGVPVFPDVRFYQDEMDVPEGFFVSVGSSLPKDMEDRLSVLYQDGQLKLTHRDAGAKLSGEAFWVMGQSLLGDGGLAVLVPSRMEAVQGAFDALADYGSNTANQDGHVFFFGPEGLKVVDLGLGKPFGWRMGELWRSLWTPVARIAKIVSSVRIPWPALWHKQETPETPEIPETPKTKTPAANKAPAAVDAPDKSDETKTPETPDAPQGSWMQHMLDKGTMWTLLGGVVALALFGAVLLNPGILTRPFRKKEKRQSTLLTRRRRSRRR
ncbi:MAG: hypothetical protein N2315_03300 [Thermanaerothrix sp.]|nr:hypothetical protein [Thermanaerothrix sp.]